MSQCQRDERRRVDLGTDRSAKNRVPSPASAGHERCKGSRRQGRGPPVVPGERHVAQRDRRQANDADAGDESTPARTQKPQSDRNEQHRDHRERPLQVFRVLREVAFRTHRRGDEGRQGARWVLDVEVAIGKIPGDDPLSVGCVDGRVTASVNVEQVDVGDSRRTDEHGDAHQSRDRNVASPARADA